MQWSSRVLMKFEKKIAEIFSYISKSSLLIGKKRLLLESSDTSDNRRNINNLSISILKILFSVSAYL